jgi:hypothetical protein
MPVYAGILYNNNPVINNSTIMFVLQIEHSVPSYEGWKKAFDSDPVKRQQSGVVRYTIYRRTDNPNYVIIDLVFDAKAEAENMLNALKKLWGRVEGQIMNNPQSRIMEMAETKEY